VPYCILSYPLMMLVLPKLWTICHRERYITLSDYVRGRYRSRWLSVAFAVTGILATMPYIALATGGYPRGHPGTRHSGRMATHSGLRDPRRLHLHQRLRAPAAIAIVKDVMLYIMVLAAVIVIPQNWAATARSSRTPRMRSRSTRRRPPSCCGPRSTGAIRRSPSDLRWRCSSTRIPSTGTLSASSANVIRRNAALMPAYNFCSV